MTRSLPEDRHFIATKISATLKDGHARWLERLLLLVGAYHAPRGGAA